MTSLEEEGGGGGGVDSTRKRSYVVLFNRNELNENILTEKYSFKKAKSDNIFNGTKNYLLKYYKPSKSCMRFYLLERFPFFKWIVKYDYKNDLLRDFIAGITIGIIQIPQGLAYSLMAGLPPIIGLYISFFSVIVYVLLGTSKHLSLGIYAIISMMTKDCLDKLEGTLYPTASEVQKMSNLSMFNDSSSLSNPEYLSNDPIQARIMIGTALSFYAGLIQVLFAVCHVGFVTKYLSDVIVAAFTTGAAYHIVVSQINNLLGIKLAHVDTIFKLIGEFIAIFSVIVKTNIAALIISIISMIFLYSVKHFINERFKEKLIVPVPVDLIVVIVGTLFSYLFNFNERWNVEIVGEIPVGIPSPELPPVKIFSYVIGESISIAIVSFAINISMAKLFAKKYKYDLVSNQELFAYGVGNIVSCFFRGFPSCVGLSRSVILDSVGARSQVYAIFASILVLIVIVAIGPLFRTLPNACLASIIVIALISLIIEVRQIYHIYKRSKIEAIAWLVTFLGVIILDIDYGLYIGLCFSLLLVIAHSQRAFTSVLGNIPNTDIYETIEICGEAQEFDGIKIIRYEASVFYANVENFIYKIIKLSGVDPNEIRNKINKRKKEHEKMMKKFKDLEKQKLKNNNAKVSQEVSGPVNDASKHKEELENKINEILNSIHIKDIIIDFSCINFIDSMGVNALIQLNESFKEVGVTLHLTYCKKKFDYHCIYPTTHDAVMSILRKTNNAHFHFVSKTEQSAHLFKETILTLATQKEPHLQPQTDSRKSVSPVYVKRKSPDVFSDITIKTEPEND